jgi:hypothetical protein
VAINFYVSTEAVPDSSLTKTILVSVNRTVEVLKNLSESVNDVMAVQRALQEDIKKIKATLKEDTVLVRSALEHQSSVVADLQTTLHHEKLQATQRELGGMAIRETGEPHERKSRHDNPPPRKLVMEPHKSAIRKVAKRYFDFPPYQNKWNDELIEKALVEPITKKCGTTNKTIAKKAFINCCSNALEGSSGKKPSDGEKAKIMCLIMDLSEDDSVPLKAGPDPMPAQSIPRTGRAEDKKKRKAKRSLSSQKTKKPRKNNRSDGYRKGSNRHDKV